MYSYETVKLEKGLYHLTNKSFLQALEEADPSAQYAGSPLAGLDAYERQLKRFDIHVSGVNCDKVEKFFTTTESAVLFPEFIRRAILQGMEETILPEITAVISRTTSSNYLGCELTDTAAYSTTNAGTALPISTIMEDSAPVTLKKYGRNIQASYEAVRQQRLDVFAVMLRRIGCRLADSISQNAITVLKTSLSESVTAAGDLEYSHITELYGNFTSFRMKAMLASPANMAKILTMNQMLEISSQDVKEIRLPFGTKLINCPQLDDNSILGIDTDFALEQIQYGDVILETDKLIERQLDSITVSATVSFRRLMTDAVKLLKITA